MPRFTIFISRCSHSVTLILCILFSVVGSPVARAWFEYQDDTEKKKPPPTPYITSAKQMEKPSDAVLFTSEAPSNITPPYPVAVTSDRRSGSGEIHQEPDSCEQNVQVIGSGVAPLVEGFGNEVPLYPALKMLAPENWRLQLHEAHPEARLSWQSGEDWLAVLGRLTPLHSHCIQVNWPTRSVSVKARERSHVAWSPTPSTTTPMPLTTNTVWKVQTDRSLRDILSDWSNTAGWQLVWETHKDYHITTRSSYVGKYREAVEHLLEDLAASGSPLGAELYTGNRVLRVREVR